jgi:hypothetical protein
MYKWVIRVTSRKLSSLAPDAPECTTSPTYPSGMHYITHVSQCDFVESIPVPPKHEKYCIDVSCLGHTAMHYVAC